MALGRAPSVDEFVAAWTAEFDRVLREVTQRDGRLYLEDARKAAPQAGPDIRPYLRTAIRFLEAREDTWSEPLALADVVADRSAYVRAAAVRAAGPWGRLSTQRARDLPIALADAYEVLRRVHLPAPRAARLAARFERLASGLSYPSESDFPYDAFSARLPNSIELSIESFRCATGFAPAVEIVIQAGKEFFGRFRDPELDIDSRTRRHYARLERDMQGRLADLFTITVGGEHVVEGQVFVFGRAADGSLAGLSTFRIWT